MPETCLYSAHGLNCLSGANLRLSAWVTRWRSRPRAMPRMLVRCGNRCSMTCGSGNDGSLKPSQTSCGFSYRSGITSRASAVRPP